MAPMPKAFLIHGFLGAGKTTLAKRLEREQDAVRFTHDEWMSKLYGDDPPIQHFQECARRVFDVMEDAWTRCIALGTNVVLDFGFWSRAERVHVRDLVSRHGGDAILYRLTYPQDISWQRIERRNDRLAGALYIAPETFEALKIRFEPLGTDEHCIEVRSDEAT